MERTTDEWIQYISSHPEESFECPEWVAADDRWPDISNQHMNSLLPASLLPALDFEVPQTRQLSNLYSDNLQQSSTSLPAQPTSRGRTHFQSTSNFRETPQSSIMFRTPPNQRQAPADLNDIPWLDLIDDCSVQPNIPLIPQRCECSQLRQELGDIKNDVINLRNQISIELSSVPALADYVCMLFNYIDNRGPSERGDAGSHLERQGQVMDDEEDEEDDI